MGFQPMMVNPAKKVAVVVSEANPAMLEPKYWGGYEAPHLVSIREKN